MCTAAPGVPGPAQLWWFPREGPRTWPVLFSVAQPRLGSAGSSEDLPALRSHPLPQVTPSPKSPPPPSHPLSWSPPPLGHALLQVTRSPGSPPPPSHPLSWVTPSPGSPPPLGHALPRVTRSPRPCPSPSHPLPRQCNVTTCKCPPGTQRHPGSGVLVRGHHCLAQVHIPGPREESGLEAQP